MSFGCLGFVFRELTATFRDQETQWMICLCFVIYYLIFLFIRFRLNLKIFWWATNSCLWLSGMLLIGAISYFFDYSSSTQILTLLTGAILGQGAAAWLDRGKPENIGKAIDFRIIPILMFYFVLASLWKIDGDHNFVYCDHARWFGPWNNPNVFGLLMGAGTALAAGMGLRGWKMEDRGWRKIVLLLRLA